MKLFKRIILSAVGSALLLGCPAVIAGADGAFEVTAVSELGTAVLSWNDVGAAKYIIERGGEIIGESGGDSLSFTDFSAEGDSVCNYTVSAFGSEGDMTESDSVQVFVQDANTVSEQMIFDCGSGTDIKYEDGKPVHYDHIGAYAGRDGDWKGMSEGDIALKSGKSIELSYLAGTNYVDFEFEGNELDLSGIKDNGFFGFLIYTDSQNKDDYPYVAFGSPGWKWTNSLEMKNKVTPGKWTFVKVNISDVINSDVNLKRINHIRFTTNGSAENQNFYVQALGFYKSAAIMLNSAEENKGKVTLTWHCDNTLVSYYRVFCNGEMIAETADLSYEYSVTDDLIFHTYYIEACAEDGKVLSKTGERQIVVYSADCYEYFMAYKDDGLLNNIGCGDNPNWSGPEYDSSVKSFGKKSLRLKIYDGVTTADKSKTDNIFMPFESVRDFSELADNGYFQLLVYADAETKEDLPSVAFCSEGYKWSNQCDLKNIELNKWNFIKVKISDMISGAEEIDMSKISEIRFFVPNTISGEYSVYVQNLGFYGEILPPTASVTDCGIDKDGNSYADVTFSKSMNEESLSGGFSADGMSIVSVLYSDDTHTARLVFDKQLKFPAEYTVTASDSVVCTFDRPLENREIKFKTGNVQNGIYVNSCKADKSALEGGVIKISSDITAVYSENEDKINIAMYTVLYDGEKVIAVSGVDIDDFSLKERRSNISDVIKFKTLGNADNVRAEVFFVDKADFGRPLCEKLEF